MLSEGCGIYSIDVGDGDCEVGVSESMNAGLRRSIETVSRRPFKSKTKYLSLRSSTLKGPR